MKQNLSWASQRLTLHTARAPWTGPLEAKQNLSYLNNEAISQESQLHSKEDGEQVSSGIWTTQPETFQLHVCVDRHS